MSQYFTDFSEFSTGAFSDPDWLFHSAVTVTPTIQTGLWETEGKILKVTTSVVGGYRMWWDIASGDANSNIYEVYMKLKMTAAASSARRIRVYGRATVDGASPPAITNSLGLELQEGGGVNWHVVTAGAASSGALGTPFAVAVQNSIYHFVWRYDGTNLYVKRWLDGDSEIGAPEYTVAKANAFPAGKIGLNWYGAGPHNVEYDRIGYGTNGEPAPREALAASPTVSSTTKLQNAQAITITGTTFEALKGTNGRVIISPTDTAGAGTGSADVAGVVQTVATAPDWAGTTITVTSALLPAGAIPGQTVYLFVRNDSSFENTAGFAVQVADPILCVDELLRDTDTGLLLNETVEVVVLGGSAGARTIILQDNIDVSIVAGKLTVENVLFSIPQLTDTHFIGVISTGTRLGLLPATVLDRNDV